MWYACFFVSTHAFFILATPIAPSAVGALYNLHDIRQWPAALASFDARRRPLNDTRWGCLVFNVCLRRFGRDVIVVVCLVFFLGGGEVVLFHLIILCPPLVLQLLRWDFKPLTWK